MPIFSALLGVLTALPQIVSLISRFAVWVNEVSGNNPQAWILKIGAAFDELKAAETTEAKLSAAKSISDAIAGL